MDILLIEPSYKTDYPPIGLMKLATYHNNRGDKITFKKGCDKTLLQNTYDRIYITTSFTFYFTLSINTIKFYMNGKTPYNNIFVGGLLASIIPDKIYEETGLSKTNIISGVLKNSSLIGFIDNINIDELIPMYSILNDADNNYKVHNCYLLSITRGCIRRCSFCVVKVIEPTFYKMKNLYEKITEIDNIYGKKRNLILLDNNILALTPAELRERIDDIKRAGFIKNATNENKRKGCYVDFNQGMDARLLTEEKMSMLSEIPIKPFRLAFDDIKEKDVYKRAFKLAIKYGVKYLSNYMLYNYEDTPEDFWKRIECNMDIKSEYDYNINLYLYPMRYKSILNVSKRTCSFIGKHWNRYYLRSLQLILISTRGVIINGAPSRVYDRYGHSPSEFINSLYTPLVFLVHRNYYKNNNLVKEWRDSFERLTDEQRVELLRILNAPKEPKQAKLYESDDADIKKILPYYNISYTVQ